MSALIRLNGVTKRYDDSPQPALDRVDLDIEPAGSPRSWVRRAAASRPCST